GPTDCCDGGWGAMSTSCGLSWLWLSCARPRGSQNVCKVARKLGMRCRLVNTPRRTRCRLPQRAPSGQMVDLALFSLCGVSGAGDRQLKQPGRVGKKERVALRGGDVEVLDQLDGARFERGQRRGVAAIDDALGPHPVEHHFHRREIVGDRVEMHLLEV